MMRRWTDRYLYKNQSARETYLLLKRKPPGYLVEGTTIRPVSMRRKSPPNARIHVPGEQ
jgi:hypothetical protein